jgi:hypothetical protein
MIVLTAIARDAGRHARQRAPEWWMACVTMAIGVQLLRDAEMANASKIYAVLTLLASGQVWGVAALGLGCLRFAALVLNGTFPRFRRISPVVRCVVALASAFFWFSLAASTVFVDDRAFGFPVFVGLMIGDLLLTVHIAPDAGRSQKRESDAPSGY